MVVYKITNLVNNKVYVGQTTRPLKTRWCEHLKDYRKNVNYVLYRAMKKHGLENFTIEKVDEAKSRSELNKKEANWIIALNSMSYQNGYNMLSVNERIETSKLTRKKMSKNSQKLWKTENYRKKVINGMKKTLSQKYNQSFNVYKALKKGSNQKGKFIGTWSNKIKCAEDLNMPSGSIRGVLSGKISQAKGYVFEYKDENLKNIQIKQLLKNKYNKNKHKLFNVYKSFGKGKSQKGEVVGTWYSQKKCADELNICPSTIPYCLIGKLKQSQGYIFEYIKGEL